MKKLLIAILLLLPLSWAGATWFSSSQTESVFDQAIAHSNENISENLPFFKIEKQSYEKGFTTSKAKSTLGLDPELFDSEEPVNVTLNHTIYHGPVMMTPKGVKSGSSYILTTLDKASLSDEAAEMVAKLFDGEEPFQIGMLTGVGETVDVDMTISRMHLDSEKLGLGPEMAGTEEFLLNLDGMNGQFSTNTAGTWLKGMMNLGEMKIIGKDEETDINMQIDPSVVKMDFDEIYNGSMLTGSTDAKVPVFTLTNGADGVNMRGLSMRSTVDDNNGNLDALAVIDVEKVLVKATKLNSEIPESNLHLSFGFKGMEREAFKDLVDASYELSRSQNAALKASDDTQVVEDMTKAMGSYFDAMGNLFSQGSESNNLIRISGDKGSSELALDLTYTESKKLFDLATIKDVIMALKGQLKLKIDKSMLAGLPAEQGMQMTMGFVQDTGDTYETVAVLNGGEVMVNGQPVPVLEMLGPMADQPLPWQAMQGLMQ